MNTCPCCSSSMLRQIEHNRLYWYCPHCHQEMPNFALRLPPSVKSSTSLVPNSYRQVGKGREYEKVKKEEKKVLI